METKSQKIVSIKDAKALVADFISSSEPLTKQRASQFAKYERFIADNQQWDTADMPDGDKPMLTFNQSEEYINTYLAKLFPRNPETGTLEIGVKVREKDKTKKEQYEGEILKVYQENNLGEILLEQGQNFLVGGDGCLYFPQDATTKSARIISLDPTSVYLGWSGNKLEQFAFKDQISLREAELNPKENKLISVIKNFLKLSNEEAEKFKKVDRITYWDNQNQIIVIGNEVDIRPNESGIIPFAWIPNKPKSGSREGRSEGKTLYDLEKEYNKRSSDFAKRVKDNTSAILAVASNLDSSKLDREEGKGILPLKQGDKAEFLHLTENREVLNFLDLIERKMDKKMAINDAVNGNIKSNVSSLAMMYYFSPLLDRIGLKRVYWDSAFRILNQAILQYKFAASNISTEPIYQPIMPLDTESKIKNTVLMLENGLITHIEAIDILRPGENSTEKWNEIKAEMETMGKGKFLKNQKVQ